MLSAGLALTPLTASADLSSGLLIYYSFSGNADDVSGNGNDGTVSGAVLGPDNSSSLDSAFVFDGTDDFIEENVPFQFERWCARRSVALPTGCESLLFKV